MVEQQDILQGLLGAMWEHSQCYTAALSSASLSCLDSLTDIRYSQRLLRAIAAAISRLMPVNGALGRDY